MQRTNRIRKYIMKRIFILFIVLTAVNTIYADEVYNKSLPTDSTKTSRTVTKSKKTEVSLSIGKSDESRSEEDGSKGSRHSGVSFGLTFARFDIGFSKLIDNGSFTLSPENEFLEYDGWKTSNVGFDLLQFGYRFNSAFKIYLSGGVDWTHLRLERNITMRRNAPVLEYDESDIQFSKNRFSSTYLRIPLSFEFRTKEDKSGKKFRFIAGPDMGFLLNGRVKQKSNENGKQKFNDDYHFTKFRYGAFARIGYGGAGLYAKYYFNDMFEKSPAQKGLKNMAFGLSIGF